MNEVDVNTWTADWLWSLPLIVVTALFHTFGLGLMNGRVTRILTNARMNRKPHRLSTLVMGGALLLVILMHGIEGTIWAAAFKLVGALPDVKLAMLYSLSALTAYGHESLQLRPQWQLMGALEALNGLILFGLTTAFLFSVIQKAWPEFTQK